MKKLVFITTAILLGASLQAAEPRDTSPLSLTLNSSAFALVCEPHDNPELSALAVQEAWTPDAFTELVALLKETNSAFNVSLEGNTVTKENVNALRESWSNIAALTDPHYSFENFGEKIKKNYRRCRIAAVPPLHIILGLETPEQMTKKSVDFLDQIVAAEKAFREKGDRESFAFLQEAFIGMYCRLEQAFGTQPFEETTKEEFLRSFALPETAQPSCEKMLALLRQSGFLAREAHDLELYKAFAAGKKAFEDKKAEYLNALHTLQLQAEALAKITNTLMMIGAGAAETPELQEGILLTTVAQQPSPTFGARLRSASARLASWVQGAFRRSPNEHISSAPSGDRPVLTPHPPQN